jgi:hypothetical protein
MTPKEKAEELVDKFYPRATSYSSDRKNQNENAKQCALIAVDELIKLYEILKPHRGFKISYLDEVKQEINKL